MNFSTSSNYECNPQMVVVLLGPVILSLIEITYIFISHGNCWRYYSILCMIIITEKFIVVIIFHLNLGT